MNLGPLAKKRIISLIATIIAVTSFYFYNRMSVEREVAPIKVIYAALDIPPHTQITADMIFERTVSSKAIPPNVYKSENDIVGKWTVDGFGVTKNSPFYEGKILSQNELPDAAILNLKENEFAFPLLVDMETSSGNALMPNTYIDLHFMTTKTDTKKPFSGKMFENIRISSVKDSKTQNVFSADNYAEIMAEGLEKSINEISQAKLFTLAVTEEQLDLLNKAKQLGDIIPIAGGERYTVPDSKEQAQINTQPNEVIQFINAQSHSAKSTVKTTKGKE